MQFTRGNAARVTAKAKTQTRRVVKEGEHLHTDGPTVFDYRERIKWQVGRTYAVCPGRGKPAIGRVRLLKIRKQKLQDISKEDCVSELGITTMWSWDSEHLKLAFANLWDSINPKGKRWADNPDVWALTFEVVGEGGK